MIFVCVATTLVSFSVELPIWKKIHCDESDVARVPSLKPGKSDTPNEYKRKSNECIELLNLLRNKGNHEHNCRVLESQEGELMLLR